MGIVSAGYNGNIKMNTTPQPNALSLANFDIVELTREHCPYVSHIEPMWLKSVERLVNNYLDKFKMPHKQNFYAEDWYGVYGSAGKLLSVVGFEQVVDGKTMIPFISHLCCENSIGGRRALGFLTQFIEAIPLRLRGLILANNGKMLTMVEHRKTHGSRRSWKTLALLVQSDYV
jgi:hypothetical protein